MREDFVLGLGFGGFHRVWYSEWGNARNKNVAVCVHGLTRNGRDFDQLAEALANDYRVVCPDVVGRGRSDWLDDPDHYNYLQYNADMNAVIARLGSDDLTWIGTSMGGIIGMVMAAMPNTPIKRLVLNDIGPFIHRAAIDRIGEYIGTRAEFETLEDVEAYIRQVYAPFGPMTDGQWRDMAAYSSQLNDRNKLELAFDPKIGEAYRRTNSGYYDMDLWDTWDGIQCPVLIVRGEHSDLLTRETVEKMMDREPSTDLIEVGDVGHTPMLKSDEEIAAVRDWLNGRADHADSR